MPFPALSKKHIPSGVTGRSGVIDRDVVTRLFSDPKWADAGIGLKANGYIGIDVDDYDDKHGADELSALSFELGALPATYTSTAREGESRQRFYRVPDHFESVSRLGSAIEVIQSSHRWSAVYPTFHETTGTQYSWFDPSGRPCDIPLVSDFAELPEQWVEHMRVQAPLQHSGFEGTIPEWLNSLEPGDPSPAVEAFLTTLKTPTSHDDVIKATYRLVRLGAERQSGVPQAFEQLWDQWVQGPYDTPQEVRHLTTAVEGAIKKAGAPEDISFEITLEKIEHPDIERLVFGDNPNDLPELLEAVSSLTPEEQRLILDGSKIGKDAPAQVAERPEKPAESQIRTGNVTLLTPNELELVERVPNFIDHYRYVAGLRDEEPNDPYYRLDAVMTLAVVLGRYAFLPAKEGVSPLNLWGLKIGKTTSGKGVSKTQFFQTCQIASIADFDSEVNFGGSTSKEALADWLIGHDGMTTLFQSDEGHGWLKTLKSKQSYMEGMQERFTDYYEGKVSAFHFKSSENSGKTARTSFCVWLQGTPRGIIESLDPDQAESGFVIRFLTVFGDDRKVKRRVDDEMDESSQALGMSPYVWALAKSLRNRAEELDKGSSQVRYVRAPLESRERLADAADKLHHAYDTHRLKDLIQPNLLRQRRNIWKIAALLALSEGRTEISHVNMLTAIREWEQVYAPSAVELLEAISRNDFERQQAEVLMFIQSRTGGRATSVSVSRAFAGMERLDSVLDRLVRSGRITREEGGNVWVAT